MAEVDQKIAQLKIAYNPAFIGDADVLSNHPSTAPIFSFGVIADIQYADSDDSKSFDGVSRYYRHALEGVRLAVNAWNTQELACIAQLGDIIDGRAIASTALASVRQVLDESRCKTMLNLVGNHECYTHTRIELKNNGLIQEAYHSCSPHPGWRFIALDGFDISAVGWPKDHANTAAAWKLLDANNPNNCRVTDGSVDWTEGLTGLDARWVPFNGAIGSVQLQWLQQELKTAVSAQESVVVLCHVPLKPGSCSNKCLLWNYDEVMQVLHLDGKGSVVAVLTGHDHDGGYAKDSQGIHHITFRSPLEAPPPTGCHAVVDVYDKAIMVQGFGTQESYALSIASSSLTPTHT